MNPNTPSRVWNVFPISDPPSQTPDWLTDMNGVPRSWGVIWYVGVWYGRSGSQIVCWGLIWGAWYGRPRSNPIRTHHHNCIILQPDTNFRSLLEISNNPTPTHANSFQGPRLSKFKRSSNIRCGLVYDIMTWFPRMKTPKISISWGFFLTLCKFESLIFCQIRKITFFLREIHSLLTLSRPLLIAGFFCRGGQIYPKK